MKGSAVMDGHEPCFVLEFYAGVRLNLGSPHTPNRRDLEGHCHLPLGRASHTFDASIHFSRRYADQNEIDYQAFVDAVCSGEDPRRRSFTQSISAGRPIARG